MGIIINLIQNSESHTLAYRVHAFSIHTFKSCPLVHFAFLTLKCPKSLPCTLSFLRFLSPSPWISVHFAHLLPLIPNPSVFPCVPAGWLQPEHVAPALPTSSALSAPRLLPCFLFFFCSVAFNSLRPLCAEWLMAPCWATVRGRKTEAEEEGKTGGDRKRETPEFLADNQVFQCCSNTF